MAEKYDIPIRHKANLTIDEAIIYTGIRKKMTSREDCPFVLWVGNRRVIKRQLFDKYIMKADSI